MTALERAARVRLMILDVDGVLTDGRLYYGAGGEAMKAFDVRDGHGIKLLHEGGVDVALLTARSSAIVAVRARELGIERVVQGAANKVEGFERLSSDAGVAPSHCGYIGDDWPDLAVLARAGFAATVADAAPEVRAVAHWIAPAAGGCGAVRQLAEFVLRAQGSFERVLARHSGSSHA
jgi:3-deoxy-D-manno-octulosonate 8-phosphate phosphatase (KDO 8-P phosphatase)